MFKKLGPAVLIAAAFIGPGTVTTCSIAGANFGFSLLWTLVLAIFATIILQEMAVRVGIITQKGLSDVIKDSIQNPVAKTFSILLILSAIVIGNTAYEGGNIGGAAMGLSAIFGSGAARFYPWIIAVIVFSLLYFGNYKSLEKILMLMVFLMSISFVLAALMTKPSVIPLLKGIFIPSFPENSTLTIIGLIGTTVVPYNIFLHASLVKEKWHQVSDLKIARTDTIVAIAIGGLVSMAITIAATSIVGNSITNVTDLGLALAPLFGKSAQYFIGIGLFSAGITSSITAPLAAAYVANHCFGWKADTKDIKFRLVWISVLLIGTLMLSFQIKPIQIIQIAQISNGILLPIIAIFLVWVVNKKSIMKGYANSIYQNIFSFIIIIITVGLGAKSLLKVFNLL